jgi:exosortase
MLWPAKNISRETQFIFLGMVFLFFMTIKPSWGYLERVYLIRPFDGHSLWVLLISVALLIRSLKNLQIDTTQPSNKGLIGVVFFFLVYQVAIVAEINLIASAAAIGLLAYMFYALFGKFVWKQVLFPMAILILSLPITSLIDLWFGFQIRLLASQIAFSFLSLLGIAKDIMGVNIYLLNDVLTVDAECSGLKALSTVLILTLVLGHMIFKDAVGKRIILIICGIAIAGLSNAIRISTIGIISYKFGPEVAQGIIHSWSGTFIFSLSLICLWPIYVQLEKK